MKYFLTLVFAFCTLVGMAQEAPIFQSDIDTAKELAASEHKNILMVFAGSDWCRPCMQFQKDVLENEAFVAYSKEHLVVLYLDFPQRRKNRLSKEQTQHNEVLAKKYNAQGVFPKVILLDAQGKILQSLSYQRTANAFIENCKKPLVE